MSEETLRERLDAVHEAAERLVRESTPPPRGYEVPQDAKGERDPFGTPEIAALFQVVELVRSAVPPELSAQLREALRELLMAVRAVIDWYLERMDRPDPGGPDVEDIPID